MKVSLGSYLCAVQREEHDPKIYSDSRLMYRVKLELNRQGHDLVKKLMYKDGHLVSEGQHYIRDRRGRYAIYDYNYAIRFAYEVYNANKPVVFAVCRGD